MIRKHVFNALLLLISTGFSITGSTQAVNKKVEEFLGREQIDIYSKTEQGKSTLRYLTFVADSSFYIVNGNASSKGYPDFSQITPITSKYTGISGTTQWTSINDFNPLLFDFSTGGSCYLLDSESYLVIRGKNEILKRLYGSTAK